LIYELRQLSTISLSTTAGESYIKDSSYLPSFIIIFLLFEGLWYANPSRPSYMNYLKDYGMLIPAVLHISTLAVRTVSIFVYNHNHSNSHLILLDYRPFLHPTALPLWS